MDPDIRSTGKTTKLWKLVNSPMHAPAILHRKRNTLVKIFSHVHRTSQRQYRRRFFRLFENKTYFIHYTTIRTSRTFSLVFFISELLPSFYGLNSFGKLSNWNRTQKLFRNETFSPLFIHSKRRYYCYTIRIDVQ